MTVPSIPLVAHFNGQTGNREASLRVIAITGQNVMLVLWDNKLIPVHSKIPGLTLDRVEVFEELPKKPKAKTAEES
jgi:hypothetical protein